MSVRLYEFTFSCEHQTLTAYAASHDQALEMVAAEADLRGLRGLLQCVDQRLYDPTGGDGPDD